MRLPNLRQCIGAALFVCGATMIMFVGGPNGEKLGIALAVAGALTIAIEKRPRISDIPFTSDGFFFSIPTALFCLTLLAGFDPGNSNDIWVLVALVIGGLSFPLSLVALFLGLVLTRCCGPTQPEWWDFPSIALCCGIAVIGAHINGSLAGRMLRRPE